LRALAGEIANDKISLDKIGKDLLATSLAEAEECLKEGRLWRSRTIAESSQLAEKVYNPALFFPPTLEFLADPARLKLLKARSMTKPKDALLVLHFDEMADGATPAVTRLPLTVQCEGGCALEEGKIGKAMKFDGKTGRVVVQGEFGKGLPLKNCTFTAWICPAAGSPRQGIVSQQKWPAGHALLLWNGSILADAGGKGKVASCRTADSLCQPDAWVHVAATVEAGKAITLYLNGDEIKKVPLEIEPETAEGPFLIGWNGWGGIQNDQSPGWFAGKIDDLKVWDRALSADEVLAEFAGKD
ncbi:MAG: LamG domain-containing protein, partial [Planctomycetota bacterium]|nr:LamG domain-containing protein [Planctomycetota bacterium]